MHATAAPTDWYQTVYICVRERRGRRGMKLFSESGEEEKAERWTERAKSLTCLLSRTKGPGPTLTEDNQVTPDSKTAIKTAALGHQLITHFTHICCCQGGRGLGERRRGERGRGERRINVNVGRRHWKVINHKKLMNRTVKVRTVQLLTHRSENLLMRQNIMATPKDKFTLNNNLRFFNMLGTVGPLHSSALYKLYKWSIFCCSDDGSTKE